VSCAVKGLLQRKRRVAVVQDAIETLAPDVGNKTMKELKALGATVVTTDEILANWIGFPISWLRPRNELLRQEHSRNRRRHQVRHGAGKHGADAKLSELSPLIGARAPIPRVGFRWS